MGFGTYDAWKQHDVSAERDVAPEAEEALPLYWLRAFYDRGMHESVAQLCVRDRAGQPFEKIAEASCSGNDVAEAIRRLREQRHAARGVL